jgi:hypothetical protein
MRSRSMLNHCSHFAMSSQVNGALQLKVTALNNAICSLAAGMFSCVIFIHNLHLLCKQQAVSPEEVTFTSSLIHQWWLEAKT